VSCVVLPVALLPLADVAPCRRAARRRRCAARHRCLATCRPCRVVVTPVAVVVPPCCPLPSLCRLSPSLCRIVVPPVARGSGPFVPSFFFLARPFFLFFRSGGNREHPKTDRRRTKICPFFAKMIILPRIVAIFRLISSSAGRSIGKLAIVSARTI